MFSGISSASVRSRAGLSSTVLSVGPDWLITFRRMSSSCDLENRLDQQKDSRIIVGSED